jgi:ring-1,2-phenylacetyl-CoA epoxidase subunit PaaD
MSETLDRKSASLHRPSPRRPSLDEIWNWLGEVPDPEIPVVSVVDLGIVRNVAWSEQDPKLCLVTVTPTYSGCPATEMIGRDIRDALLGRGVPRVRLQVQLSPAWTTDWLTEKARANLREYGIAPPVGSAVAASNGMAASLVVLGRGAHTPLLACPRCGSTKTETISRFGSTPCKSLHRCMDCLEPFDHFKCH